MSPMAAYEANFWAPCTTATSAGSRLAASWASTSIVWKMGESFAATWCATSSSLVEVGVVRVIGVDTKTLSPGPSIPASVPSNVKLPPIDMEPLAPTAKWPSTSITAPAPSVRLPLLTFSEALSPTLMVPKSLTAPPSITEQVPSSAKEASLLTVSVPLSERLALAPTSNSPWLAVRVPPLPTFTTPKSFKPPSLSMVRLPLSCRVAFGLTINLPSSENVTLAATVKLPSLTLAPTVKVAPDSTDNVPVTVVGESSSSEPCSTSKEVVVKGCPEKL